MFYFSPLWTRILCSDCISCRKMNTCTIFFYFSIIFFLLFKTGVGEIKEDERNVYIVYMGSVPSNPNATVDLLEEEHFLLLASVVKSEEHHKKAILRRYRHGFSGFAALLTEEEAVAISKSPRVVSVFADPTFQLHTTRSWDFLDLQASVVTESNPISSVIGKSAMASEDTIVGLLDTGIWPESESFNDDNMGPIPARWNGTCEKGDDFDATNCNRKLIGARFYNSEPGPVLPSLDQSPRDNIGHGTHTASTAAGNAVQGASYYGLAAGTARGGSPASRIAVYKVCGENGCPGSAILAAFDDAIADGVDVLSLSLGASPFLRPDFVKDPIAIGALHAVAKGIMVVCSAGNAGPQAGTVVNAAPWILTVAATTIDRSFTSGVVLGDETAIKGEAINFSKLNKSAIYPLVYGGSAANSNDSQSSARSCDPGSLDKDKIEGKIVFCTNLDSGLTKKERSEGLRSLGAKGMVLADDSMIARTYLSLPLSVVSLHDGDKILSYINSTRDPVATILPTETTMNYRPAPAVAEFSSRGPSIQTSNILKPDIAAPGVNILAAWPALNNPLVVPPGEQPTLFNLLSGTSMSCPHISGIAASIRSSHPDWSPSAIKSAIMTTAIQINDNKAPVATDSGFIATGYDYGAGQVDPPATVQPGLIYELEMEDYLQFLCNYGYNTTTIRIISPLPDGFECPKNANADFISDLNYPTIAVSISAKENRTVTRRVTNIGEEETTYTASIKSPDGLRVTVIPSELQFTKKKNKHSYQVTFSSSSGASSQEDLFGTITWSDGKQSVKSTFVVGNH